MIKVKIPLTVTTDAIKWASHNLKSRFNVQHDFPGSYYTFVFDNEKDANFFALKWVQ